jgi:hypothetical protein
LILHGRNNMKTRYESVDKFLFDSPFECVAHEFIQFSDILDKFNQVMDSMDANEQVDWRGANLDDLTQEPVYGGAFAGSMGYANDKVYQAGFTYYHWAVWFYSLPDEMKHQKGAGYQLILKDIPHGEVKIKAMALLRAHHNLDLKSVLALFSDVGNVLERSIFSRRHHLAHFQSQLDDIGLQTEIIKPVKRWISAEEVKFPVPKAQALTP